MEPSKKSFREAPKERAQQQIHVEMSRSGACNNGDSIPRSADEAEGRMYQECDLHKNLPPNLRRGGFSSKLKRQGCSLRNLPCVFFVAALCLSGCAMFLVSQGSFLTGWRKTHVSKENIPQNFDAIEAVDINGRTRMMKDFSTMVKVIVNVASKCSLTARHYDELQKLQRLYGNQGFVVLAFPCRQFFTQEYASPADIKSFVSELGIEFPVFTPVDVNGQHTHPVFLYCKWNAKEFYNPSGDLSDIGWNFGKFLLDRSNRVYKYYGPRTAPLDLAEDIEALLHNRVEGWRRPSTDAADTNEKPAKKVEGSRKPPTDLADLMRSRR